MCSVVEVYLKNNYLKSFGYQKLKMTEEIMLERKGTVAFKNSAAGNRKYAMQDKDKAADAAADDEEFYYDNK